MAFKMKGSPMHMGTASHASALKAHTSALKKTTASPLTKTSAFKAGEVAYGGTRTWKEGQEASGGTLNDLVAKRKTLKKGSNEWKANQNAINEALGSKKRYDVEETKKAAPEPTVTETDKKGRVRSDTKTVADPNAPDFDPDRTMDVSSKYRKDGSLKSDVTTRNESTYDAETGEGSSGMGETDTKTRYKRSGDARRRQVTTGDMGTSDISDDAKRITKTGKRKTKVKTKTPGVGTTKTKTFTRGKRAGQTVTRVRKKGQLFGRKVKQASNTRKQVSNRSIAKAAKELGVSVDSQAASEKAFYDNARPKSAADIAKAKAKKEAETT